MKTVLILLTVIITLSAQDLIGSKAYTFFLKDKNSTPAKTIKMAEYTESCKAVILAFYSENCLPCRAELPFLQKESDSREGVELIAISVDKAWGESQQKLITDMGFTAPVLHDKFKILSKKYGYTGRLPYTVYIDKSGVISAVSDSFSEEKKEAVITLLDGLERD